MAFLQSHDESWACFLVTFPATQRTWHGYFSFRPGNSERAEDEVRTTDIFVEASEAEIDVKARNLGRPLLQGLLSSALHTRARDGAVAEPLRGRFRSLLSEHSVGLAGDWVDDGTTSAVPAIDRLRSLYESYRIDQVAHFICLVDADAFDEAVDLILDGKQIDFGSRDRVQFARMVVDHIESLLPLPDFDTWVEDFAKHPRVYQLYAHTLHRSGRLP